MRKKEKERKRRRKGRRVGIRRIIKYVEMGESYANCCA